MSHKIAWLSAILIFLWLLGDLLTRSISRIILSDGIPALLCGLFLGLLYLTLKAAPRWALVITANILCFIVAMSMPREAGGNLYFFMAVFLPWLLFPKEKKLSIYFLSAFSMGLFAFLESPWRERFLGPPYFYPEPWAYGFNAGLTLAACFFVGRAFFESSERKAKAVEISTESKLQKVVDSNIVGVVMGKLATGVIHQANDAFLKMTGYSREDLKEGRINMMTMTPPEYKHISEKAYQRLRYQGRSGTFEKEYFAKDGSRIPVVLGISALGHADKDDCVAFVVDLRAEKRLVMSEEKLRKSIIDVQSRDDFCFAASHELKTPLTSLLLQMQFLERSLQFQNPDIHQLKKLVQSSHALTHRLCGVVEQLLNVTLIQAGRFTLSQESMDLTSAVRECIDSLENAGILKRGQIHFSADGNCAGHWDPSRISQVLNNLISNAAQYGGDRPIMIHASYLEAERKVSLVVQDEGVGIAPERLDQIFNKYGRDSQENHEVAGLGLGLFVVKSIVEAHGGSVRATSKLGEGTSIQFELPVNPPDNNPMLKN